MECLCLGNLPPILGKTNKYGTPIIAMIITALFNIALIFLKTPSAILAASAIGYVSANGTSSFAYIKANTDPRFANIEKPFKAPAGWKYVAMFFGILNIPVYFIGIIVLNSFEGGFGSTLVGIGVLILYLPLWVYTQRLVAEK